MWEVVSAIAAGVGVALSLVAIVISARAAKVSTSIATEALKTARQANDIALGRLRDPPIIEFLEDARSRRTFEFYTPDVFAVDLVHTIFVKNTGPTSIDGLAVEVIGIEPLTHQVDAPSTALAPLPSVIVRMDFTVALAPDRAAMLDVCPFLLSYLKRLASLLPDKNATYQTVVNVVLSPKASREQTPSSGPSNARDRCLLIVIFRPDVLHAPQAARYSEPAHFPHRVY